MALCGPRVAPGAPDADRAFYEMSDDGIVPPSLVWGSPCEAHHRSEGSRDHRLRDAQRGRRPTGTCRRRRGDAVAGREGIAVDADHLAIDRLYRALKVEQDSTILPLIGNLTDPSPGLGWCHQERQTLEARSRPDLILALALIHYLSIGRNVPLPELVAWFTSFEADVVIEVETKPLQSGTRTMYYVRPKHAS